MSSIALESSDGSTNFCSSSGTITPTRCNTPKAEESTRVVKSATTDYTPFKPPLNRRRGLRVAYF